VPRRSAKLRSPRTPSPTAVQCSTFEGQLHHCYKAFDGDWSSNSAWISQPVGSRRNSISPTAWILLDLGVGPNTPIRSREKGIDEGRRVHPTAMKISCGAGNALSPEGCPMTFTLSGSNYMDKGFHIIKSIDLYDYNTSDFATTSQDPSIYTAGGRMFYFFDTAPTGRINGQRCGSCDRPPKLACSTNAYDSSCSSEFCGERGLCAAPTPCPRGFYQDIQFLTQNTPNLLCRDCPAGHYGAEVGLTSQLCSGKCDAGCFCTEGSRVSCQYPCGGSGELFCPIGSSAPVKAGVGVKTVDTDGNWNDDRTLARRVDAIPCSKGHYCVDGIERECPIGTFGNASLLTNEICSGFCPAGTYCPLGSIVPAVCPPGHYCPDGRMKVLCPPGRYGATPGRVALLDRSF
jgi:hypothetical protein